MAQGVAARRIAARGLGTSIQVDSAGTSGYHQGEPADRRTMQVLAAHGIDLDCRSRPVEPSDFETFDHLLAMDASNLANLRRMCPPEHHHKLALVLEPLGGGDVPDPYYGGPDGFELNYRQLSGAIDIWLDRVAGGSRFP